jgi:Dyp-type peroxidase family
VAAQTVSVERADVQGLVARGYGRLKEARFVLFRIDHPAGARDWLNTLVPMLTSAADEPEYRAVNIAFTASGARKLGLDHDAVGRFALEFRDGMTSPHRSRILGDRGDSGPERWAWGGPGNPEIDAVLLVYGRSKVALAETLGRAAPRHGGVTEIVSLQTATLTALEHFGFHDGISQPAVEGLTPRCAPANTVKVGEFLLGYPNEYGLVPDRALLDSQADPGGLLPRRAGRADLGRNGSYLVLRELVQDVPGFWGFVERAASGGRSEAVRLASKMVGRWPGGAPLVAAPEHDDPTLGDHNDFFYHLADPHGLLCPKGAHVRRSNPRGSLAPEPGSDRSIAIGKRHRILRRGRQFGTWVSPLVPDVDAPRGDDEARGLYFICLNANLARQFEFIQHTWLNNPKFDGLYDDTDPLVSTASTTFTALAEPFRERITGVPSFVTVRGGAYFFLPGIRAVRYLASLE